MSTEDVLNKSMEKLEEKPVYREEKYTRPSGNIATNHSQVAMDLIDVAIKNDLARVALKKMPKNSYHSLRTALHRCIKTVREKNSHVGKRLKITKVKDMLYVACVPTNFIAALDATIEKLQHAETAYVPITNAVQKAIALQYLRASDLKTFTSTLENEILIVKGTPKLDISVGSFY